MAPHRRPVGARSSDGDQGRRKHVGHEHLPDADLVGLGVPAPVLGAQDAAGGECRGDAPLAVLGADPVGGFGAGGTDIDREQGAGDIVPGEVPGLARLVDIFLCAQQQRPIDPRS